MDEPVPGQPVTAQAATEPSGQPPVGWAAPQARPVPGHPQIVFADMPNRTIAYIVDILVVLVVAVIIGIVVGLATLSGGTTNGGFGIFANLLASVAIAVYFIYSWTRRRTIGMRMLGLQIGNSTDGATLTVEQSIRRWVALFGPSVVYEVVAAFGSASLTAVVGLIAFVWTVYLFIDTARSPTKQGFHDRFAGSAVVKLTRAPG